MTDLDQAPCEVGPEPRRHDRLHGRRRGRKLRKGQSALLDQALPRHQTTVAEIERQGHQAIFASPRRQIWLEVGYGGGEHLSWQAQQNPEVGLIGCEIFQQGIVSALKHLESANIENVRLVIDDARLVIDALADASIDRAFVLFPDPWRKARHHKRRFIQKTNLDALARIMVCGAELRVGTDHVDYLRAILAALVDHPAFTWSARAEQDWRVRPDDWPQTRYEAKAIRQGRRPAFLRFIRVPRGTERPDWAEGSV